MAENKKTILVVEDEQSMANALMDKIKLLGFKSVWAKDGEEGLMMALENKPDLILLDLLMPKMNGLDMMTQLRKDSWGKSVKIIILTNLDADDKVLEQVVQNEPAFYLLKADWKIDDVMGKIKDIIG